MRYCERLDKLNLLARKEHIKGAAELILKKVALHDAKANGLPPPLKFLTIGNG